MFVTYQKKINDIFKNKKTKKIYVLIAIIDNNYSQYLNLEDKYVYNIPDDDMELWYESRI